MKVMPVATVELAGLPLHQMPPPSVTARVAADGAGAQLTVPAAAGVDAAAVAGAVAGGVVQHVDGAQVRRADVLDATACTHRGVAVEHDPRQRQGAEVLQPATRPGGARRVVARHGESVTVSEPPSLNRPPPPWSAARALARCCR